LSCKEAFILGDTFLVNDLQECLADIERGRVLAGKGVELRRFGSGEFRVRDEVLEPQATPKQLRAIQMLDEGRRRIALESGKTYVEYRRPDWIAEMICPPGVDPTIMILNAWRKRTSEENARLEQEAAADASERNI
jgi:hypothetical protein